MSAAAPYAIIFCFGFVVFGGQMLWRLGSEWGLDVGDYFTAAWFGTLTGSAFCLLLYGVSFIPE